MIPAFAGMTECGVTKKRVNEVADESALFGG